MESGMTDDDRDIGPDNGQRPPFAKPIDEGRGAVGTGGGYSGQEYDLKGQAEWRAEQTRANMAEDGVARGSGAGAGRRPRGRGFRQRRPGRLARGEGPGGSAAGRDHGSGRRKSVPGDGIEPPTLRFSIACSTN